MQTRRRAVEPSELDLGTGDSLWTGKKIILVEDRRVGGEGA